jgi:cupin fold WbuC family metalloprotein
MTVLQLTNAWFDELSGRARGAARLRQHSNLHRSYEEPCQRLLNALEPGTYIPPHRHSLDPKQETLIALRGEMALVLFDDSGKVTQVVRFGAGDSYACHGVDLPPGAWHTVLALSSGAILFEAKAGPFQPAHAKELAPWAPSEDSPQAADYLAHLRDQVT